MPLCQGFRAEGPAYPARWTGLGKRTGALPLINQRNLLAHASRYVDKRPRGALARRRNGSRLRSPRLMVVIEPLGDNRQLIAVQSAVGITIKGIEMGQE